MARKRKSKARYGSGSVRPPRSTGGTWSIQWRVDGELQYKGGFDNEALAMQTLAAIINGVNTPATEKASAKDGPTLGELFDQWSKNRLAHITIHRSAPDEINRWKGYLKKPLESLRPAEVTKMHLKAILMEIRGRGLAASTAHNAMKTLSTFYSDLVEEGYVIVNPVRQLPKKWRKTYMKSPKVDGPFVESMTDVSRTIEWLAHVDGGDRYDISCAYAIGALAGLRTGEVIGLDWTDIDFERMLIFVRRQVQFGRVGPLKDGDDRVVGLQVALRPILMAYKARIGGKGKLFPPTTPGKGGGWKKGVKTLPASYLALATLNRHLHKAQDALELPKLSWYQSTRHTFASHYMMQGGNLSKLQDEMGHSDIQTTQRYAKLSPAYRTDADRNLLQLPGAIDGKLMEALKKVTPKNGADIGNN